MSFACANRCFPGTIECRLNIGHLNFDSYEKTCFSLSDGSGWRRVCFGRYGVSGR